MRIGQLAKLSGLAPSRIRFYEASGLLKSVERKANGYRDYGVESVWILDVITCAQGSGFSLEEIRHLLPMGGNPGQHAELLAGLKRKMVEIQQLQEQLGQADRLACVG